MKKAIVETATGKVVNVIEIEYDADGGFSHWRCPDGCQILDLGPNAQPGATWDGAVFTAPGPPPLTRLDILRLKLVDGSITDAETQEMLRIERGVQGDYEQLQEDRARLAIL